MTNDVPNPLAIAPPCMESSCAEVQDSTVEIYHDGTWLVFGVCVEHAFDIDWGVYLPKVSRSMRGYLGPAADADDVAI